MTVRLRGIIAALHFVISALAVPAYAAEQDGKPLLQAIVSLAFDATAGTAKAGMLCMPNGRFRVADFVVSDSEFSARAREALLPRADAAKREKSAAIERLRITLDRIDASLCARKYGAFGLGDRRSLSGQIEFEFSWSVTGGATARHEIVRLEVPKNRAKAAEALLPDALAVLADRIAAFEFGVFPR